MYRLLPFTVTLTLVILTTARLPLSLLTVIALVSGMFTAVVVKCSFLFPSLGIRLLSAMLLCCARLCVVGPGPIVFCCRR